VLVVIADKRLALEGVANQVAIPAPALIPVLTGNPVQLDKVPDVGVPSAGVMNVGELFPQKWTLPVEPDNPTSTALFVVMLNSYTK
jgi:hypothetical protein